MGSRSAGKAVEKLGKRGAAVKAAPVAAKKKRPASVESAKYEQSGAPWWKRHLPG